MTSLLSKLYKPTHKSFEIYRDSFNKVCREIPFGIYMSAACKDPPDDVIDCYPFVIHPCYPLSEIETCKIYYCRHMSTSSVNKKSTYADESL